MQAILGVAHPSPPRLSQAEAQAKAIAYLTDVLGPDYTTTSSTYGQAQWHFLIRWLCSQANQPCIVGRLTVDAQTGTVVALTDDQIREVHECADWEAARLRGELARDAQGYVSRHQARRLAQRWLDLHLAMKYGATGGFLIPLEPPVWQFSIDFTLQAFHLEPLGVIDVNAQTGAVVPLRDEQLTQLRERVRAVIRDRQPSAAR